MILAKDIKKLVRYKQKDNDEITFSDYDIKNALNEALRFVTQSQSLQNSDFLETFKLYDQEEMNREIEEGESEDVELYDFPITGVELPDDYCILAGVTDVYGRDLSPVDATQTPKVHEYKVMGGRIYTGVYSFKLTYKKTLPNVTDLDEDEIDLPTFCTDIIVKITGMVLNNAETDIMLQQIDSMSKSIIPRRRYNGLQMKMPFYV